MMKPLYIIFFCFFIAVLYLSSSSHNTSSSDLTFVHGRQPPRKLSMSLTNNKHEYHDMKVIEGESETLTAKEISVSAKYSNSNSDLDDLVYHIDYHGVTTHPTPTPRHPKP